MPYRVMVVDDSAFMRKIISDLIEQDPEFQVEGTAKDGREAIEQITRLKPDLVTMDVEMPEMNGLDALKAIMKQIPLPVIMLSGINEQGMRETIMALELGAFDFIRKPSASTSSHDIKEVGRLLLEKMHVAMQAKERRKARDIALAQKTATVVKPSLNHPVKPPERRPDISPPSTGVAGTNKRADKEPGQEIPKAKKAPRNARETEGHNFGNTRENAKSPTGSNTNETVFAPRPQQTTDSPKKLSAPENKGDIAARDRPIGGNTTMYTDLVAIGTSTGGPKALKAVLEKIPGNFPAPIVIVQHMPPNFTKSLAQRLNSLSQLNVVEAEQGMTLQSGTAYIAPGGFHLNVVARPDGCYKLRLTEQEPCNGHRPSVDVLYESLLSLQALRRHIVLLTGMGSDGAKVMKRLYDAGVTSTIAESEETCVVYGMPRSAVELNCVSHVLPLYEIGPKLVQIVK